MKKTIIPAVAVALIAAAVAVYALVARHRPEAPTLRLSGNIEVTAVEVSFRIPGRMIQRRVSEGAAVRAGQVIALLDPADIDHEISLRRGELDAARAALGDLEAGFRPEEIAQAHAALRAQRSEAERQESEFHRQEGLYAQDVISKRELEAASAGFKTSSERVREAEERLRLLQNGSRKEQVEVARARVRQSEAALAASATRLGYTTLTSPISGVVLSDGAEAGEQVSAGTPVVTIGNLDDLWLRAYVDETDLGRILLGQPVRVSTDTFRAKNFSGRITFIASEAEFTPKQVQTEKERVKLVYRVKISLENPRHELKPGMPADAVITLP